ncbi:MAG: septum formation inhibitor Maf [Clostridia bacterium]|nr:septum formation inhibitor Maf [Clostridia bacterium]
MIKLDCPLILASGSARRRELLSLIAPDFTIEVSDVDESCTGTPDEMVLTLSERKAEAVAAIHNNAVVLGADTLVYGSEVLGKPHTVEHAIEMLKALSGKWHDVFTGVTLIDTRTNRKLKHCERTRVHFRELDPCEIEAYALSGEPLDKAGAYAIQGAGDAFIDRIEGSYSNVVGLPLSALTGMFKALENEE